MWIEKYTVFLHVIIISVTETTPYIFKICYLLNNVFINNYYNFIGFIYKMAIGLFTC